MVGTLRFAHPTGRGQPAKRSVVPGAPLKLPVCVPLPSNASVPVLTETVPLKAVVGVPEIDPEALMPRPAGNPLPLHE